MPPRNVHLVGSVPLANAREVFETVSAALGPRLLRIPDGETGERSDWITWLEPVFADHPAFEKSNEVFRVHATGTARTRYRLRPGASLDDVAFDNLSMPMSPSPPTGTSRSSNSRGKSPPSAVSRSIWFRPIR